MIATHHLVVLGLGLGLAFAVAADAAPNEDGPRRAFPLEGTCWIAKGPHDETERAWRVATVPDAFETALGAEFDGVATYRREFTLPAGFGGERLAVEFDAVATHARVFVNGVEIGRHLGGWTSFRCDATAAIRRTGVNELRVEVDERVGHDTQGFLPIVQPHFGGIWQGVRLLALGRASFVDREVLCFGDSANGDLLLEAPLEGDVAGTTATARVTIGDASFETVIARGRNRLPVTGFERWSPARPALYDVTFELRDAAGALLDRITRRAGFRHLEARGRELFLDSAPLQIRGILEWGVYPPALTPNRDPALFRAQVREAKARGFNLIKFCLWVPPQPLLDVMDELGMLAWVEYPTWHPRFDVATRTALFAEFDEFFAHDRSHPSVIVRSLTCETGPSAPLEVMEALYERAHERIPNALVEDDSSWIAWNRIHDFYDDHPYGNNDGWPAVLSRLDAHIREREAKPLLLGEAIAADTWLDRAVVRDAAPHWRPLALDALDAFEAKLLARFGRGTVLALLPDSLRYCLNERKDQIEVFRSMLPDAGYVVSVARDFRLASMGLADALDRWKWRTDEWAWHGDTMLLLEPRTPRGIEGGQLLELPIDVAHHGASPLPPGVLRYRFGDEARGEIEHDEIAPGGVTRLGTLELDAPDVFATYRVPLELWLGEGDQTVTNAFDFHVVPSHAEAPPEPAHDHDPGEAHDHDHHHGHDHAGPPRRGPARADAVAELEALTPEWLTAIEEGRRVLLAVSTAPGSFVAPRIWMLRGSLWMPEGHPVLESLSREFFLDLSVHELHPSGLVPLARLFDEVTPIVGFFDSHDHGRVDDYGLLFETSIGEGRLVVATLPLHGSPAARHLRDVLLDHLANGPPPAVALGASRIAAMRDRLAAATIDLTALDWEFRPEPEGVSEAEYPPFAPIRVGRHWEGQGHPALDGRARYRLEFQADPEFVGRPLHLALDGADDAYSVIFDGERAGGGGDVATRTTAFDTKATHLLTPSLEPGRHVLEIEVVDWAGAGGLHRPLRLSTAPLADAADFLRPR
jgi:hypothetical protein